MQLCNHAAQASFKLSFDRPGSSLQEAKIHLLLARVTTVWGVMLAVGGVGEKDSLASPGEVTEGELQDTKRSDTNSAPLPTMRESRSMFMGFILLEALLALLVLLFIVWWTMFSGRQKGERITEDETPARPNKKDHET